MFAAIFPSACFQDAMCHDGTNSAGKPHTYFASDVLESENHPDAEPSHQVLFAKSLLRLEGQPLPPDQEIHNRARSKPLDEINPEALAYLFLTADGGWEPTEFLSNDIADRAHIVDLLLFYDSVTC